VLVKGSLTYCFPCAAGPSCAALQMTDLPTEVVTMLAFLEDMVTMSKVRAGCVFFW
jgi:hypothetical protein